MKNNGLFLGVSAYVLWGIIPLYWKLLPHVPALDLLSYRVVWSLAFMMIYLLLSGNLGNFKKESTTLFKNKKATLSIIAAAIFITINWGTFIYSVSIGQVQSASLGYYINPLVNVLLATLYLHEPLGRPGKIASILALIGVIILTLQNGEIPYLSLVMAFAFSLYGLIKKKLVLSSTTGLTIETAIIFPLALIYLLVLSGNGFMTYDLKTNLLLMGAGAITAIPLLLFAEAAKRLSYITLGFIQYINPTIMLLMAIFLFHEPYHLPQFLAFGFIWLGILVFVVANLTQNKRQKIAGE